MDKKLESENEIFQERLNFLIEEKGISQKDLADYVGVTRQSISLYARGERTPDINVLKEICNCFNVSSDYLIGRTSTRVSNITNEEINKRLGLTDYAIDMLNTYNQHFDGNHLISIVNYLIEQEYPLTLEEEWNSIYQYGDILEEHGVAQGEIDEILRKKEKELEIEIKEWTENHVSILSKIEDYYLVSIDKDDLYITEKSINKSKDFKNDWHRNTATLRRIDVNKIVDQVFLSEIQEALKESKANYLKTKPKKDSNSFAPEE